MKKILLTAFSGVLLAGLSFAQSNPLPTNGAAAQPQPSTPKGSQQIPDPSASQPQSQPQSPAATQPSAGPAGASANSGNRMKIAPGSVIPVQLTKTVDAKKAKSGDEVVAKVTQDMKSNSGDVLVPKDTKVIGHVTEAQARNKEQKESEMGIAFDHAVMKDGNQVNLPMSIQAVIGMQNNAANAGPGNDQGGGPATSAGAGQTAAGAGRPGMGGGGSTPPSAGDNSASTASGSSNAGMPPINGQTTGVIGISHLNLQSGANGNQGSVLTSDKNNVKLESGTMLLLKVNQH